MANATLNTLAQTLALVALDPTAVSTYQDEIIYELSRMSRKDVEVQTGASFIAAAKGTTVYTLPAADFARTPMMVFYDDTQLAQAGYKEAQFYDPNWRTSQGRPAAFLTDTIDRPQFASIPSPDHDGTAIGGSTPTTFTNWPTDNYAVVYARSDLSYAGTSYTDTHLALVFDMIARELNRDSDHKDPAMSSVAQELADLFWSMSFPPDSL